MDDWIDGFLSKKCNKWMCRIDSSFVRDKFNTTGLLDESEDLRVAWYLIQDKTQQFDQYQQVTQESIQEHAEILYGLLHQRYILTTKGLTKMMEKYNKKEFGGCPRHCCESNNVLPVGLHDEKSIDSVKVYCSKCNDIYVPKDSKIQKLDGAYFGTTFPHLFFMVFPELNFGKNEQYKTYIPKVFGFKLHRTSHERALECQRQQDEDYKQQKIIKMKRKQIERKMKLEEESE